MDAAFKDEEKGKLYIQSYVPGSGSPPKLIDRSLNVVEHFEISEWNGEYPPLSEVDDCSPIDVSQIDRKTIAKVFEILEQASFYKEPESTLRCLAKELKIIEYHYEPIRRLVAGFENQVDKMFDKNTA